MIKHVRVNEQLDQAIIEEGLSYLVELESFISSLQLPGALGRHKLAEAVAPLKNEIGIVGPMCESGTAKVGQGNFEINRHGLLGSIEELVSHLQTEKIRITDMRSQTFYETHIVKPVVECKSNLESALKEYTSELSEEELTNLVEIFGLQPVQFKGEVGTAARNLLNAEKSILDDLKALKKAIQKNSPRTQLPTLLKNYEDLTRMFDATFDKATKSLKTLVRDITTAKKN